MLRQFFNRFRRAPRQVLIVHRDISRVTLNEWRSNPEMTKLAAKYVNDREVRMMLDVLRCSASPANAMLRLEADLDTRAVWQARTEGYMGALNDFESLAELAKEPVEVEATYEPPEFDQAQTTK